MVKDGVAFGVSAFATAFAATLILVDYPEEGPVVLSFSYSHGLHRGDLLLLAGWALVVGVMMLLRRGPRER